MDRSTSLFLDICRFSAAMVVFLGHSSGQLFTGGIFWQFGYYTQTAVIIFFVLSGYVIGYVAETREITPWSFTISRLARLYSVVLPALALTFVCDEIGLSLDPGFYYEGPWGYPDDHIYLGYLASFIFLNSIWGVDLNPGINAPFWSLGYEVFYYAFFGVAYFVSGIRRWIVLGGLMLLAGPSIVSLLPIWLLGYGLYRSRNRFQLSRTISALLLLFGALFILASPNAREIVRGVTLPMLREAIIADYLDAIGFCLLVAGFWYFSDLVHNFLAKFSREIRWLASLTFALYLFHRPLIQILGVLGPDNPASIERRLFILIGTVLIVATFGRWCETLKTPIRTWLITKLVARHI